MRVTGLFILGLGAMVAAILGWHQIWHIVPSARGLDLMGWLCGTVGLALLVGRRQRDTARRLVMGLMLSALGLALMAIPSDSSGFLVGVRVGYAGCMLAVLPHCWRLYRESRRVVGRV